MIPMEIGKVKFNYFLDINSEKIYFKESLVWIIIKLAKKYYG